MGRSNCSPENPTFEKSDLTEFIDVDAYLELRIPAAFSEIRSRLKSLPFFTFPPMVPFHSVPCLIRWKLMYKINFEFNRINTVKPFSVV